MSFNDLHAAVYQGQPVRGDIEANLCIIEAVLKDCKLKRVDIILFPELFISGYDLTKEEFDSVAMNSTSDMAYLCSLAKENNCAIAVGYPESTDELVLYNSCILIDDSGQIALNYRKTHLWDPEMVHEKVVFTVGDELPVVDLHVTRLGHIIRVGILICFDCEFPEPARLLALQGMKLLLIPTALADSSVDQGSGTNSGSEIIDVSSCGFDAPREILPPAPPTTKDVTPTVIVSSRAMENHVFVLYANLVGICMLETASSKPKPRFCGQSAIITPSGVDLARASTVGNGMLTATLNYDEFAPTIARNNYLVNRRSQLYLSTASKFMSIAPTTSQAQDVDPGRAVCTIF